MSVIYLISVDRTPLDGVVYVGKAKNFGARKHQHLFELYNGTHHNERLQDAFDVYGEDALSWQVLEEVSDERLDTAERYWIAYAAEKFGRERVLNLQLVPNAPSATADVSAGVDEVKRLMNQGIRKTTAIRAVFGFKGGTKFQEISAML